MKRYLARRLTIDGALSGHLQLVTVSRDTGIVREITQFHHETPSTTYVECLDLHRNTAGQLTLQLPLPEN